MATPMSVWLEKQPRNKLAKPNLVEQAWAEVEQAWAEVERTFGIPPTPNDDPEELDYTKRAYAKERAVGTLMAAPKSLREV